MILIRFLPIQYHTLVSIVLAVFISSACSVVYADEFQVALKAWQNKDYTQAIKLFKTLAKQGDSRAQYNLGLAYRRQANEDPKLSRQYLVQSRTGGLIDSYLLAAEIPETLALSSPNTWLFSQNKQSYTLQLATGKIPDYLKKMQDQLIATKKLEQSENLSILNVKAVDKQDRNKVISRYILVYGVFDTYQEARAEVVRLPQSLQKSSPWIRQFEALQMIVNK